MSGNQVENASQNTGTQRGVFYSIFSWSPREVERRLGIVPLDNTRTKTTGSAENSPPGTAENKAPITKENRVSVAKESITKENEAQATKEYEPRVTIQENEERPVFSRKAGRRLSDYRDSKEIEEMIKERKESKSKKDPAQKEKRSSKHLQDFREEEGITEYVKAKRESKLAEKERRESERKNSKDQKKSSMSKHERSRPIPKVQSDYRDDEEFLAQRASAVKSRDSKMTKRSSYHPSEATAVQLNEQTENERKGSRKSADIHRKSRIDAEFKRLTRGSKDYREDYEFIAQRSSMMKRKSKLKERSELTGNQDQIESSDID